jgi:putative membrane protein
MVTWFAGLFYLPRLFVYHAMSVDEISIDRFKTMERKLYYGIMTPSAVLATLFGISLAVGNGLQNYLSSTWFVIKLLLVAILIGYHFYCGALLKRFRHDDNRHGHVFYRWLNEFPVVILIAVVILAVVKPFQ